MRKTRKKKYRQQNRMFSIFTQLLVIWLALYCGMNYFTSGTLASFTSSPHMTGSITLGSWWDKSVLAFTSNKSVQFESCEPVQIDFGISNKGFTMEATTKYEVYYSLDGNPRNGGEKAAEGDVQPIEAGKEAVLTHTADKEGSYIFKVYQRPGYEDEANSEIWSGQITIKCSAVEKAPEKEVESANPKDSEIVEKKNNEGNVEAPLDKENSTDTAEGFGEPEQPEDLNDESGEKIKESKEEEEPSSEKQEDANGENIEQS